MRMQDFTQKAEDTISSAFALLHGMVFAQWYYQVQLPSKKVTSFAIETPNKKSDLFYKSDFLFGGH